jgi:hypothetical protein
MLSFTHTLLPWGPKKKCSTPSRRKTPTLEIDSQNLGHQLVSCIGVRQKNGALSHGADDGYERLVAMTRAWSLVNYLVRDVSGPWRLNAYGIIAYVSELCLCHRYASIHDQVSIVV